MHVELVDIEQSKLQSPSEAQPQLAVTNEAKWQKFTPYSRQTEAQASFVRFPCTCGGEGITGNGPPKVVLRQLSRKNVSQVDRYRNWQNEREEEEEEEAIRKRSPLEVPTAVTREHCRNLTRTAAELYRLTPYIPPRQLVAPC